MFTNKELKKLEEKIDKLSDDIHIILERQNKQYTDIMMFLKSNTERNITTIDNRTKDELYETIKNDIIKSGSVSTSYIQRKLKVGYARAVGLLEMFEDRGIVEKAKGARPRKVLVKK